MIYRLRTFLTLIAGIVAFGAVSSPAQTPPAALEASTNLEAAAASVRAASTNLAAAMARPGNAQAAIASATTNLAAALATLAKISKNLAASNNPAMASAARAEVSTNLARASTNLSVASANLASAATALAPGPHKPPPPNPTNLWHMTVSLGLTLARGNTDTTLFSAAANAKKRWPGNDLTMGVEGLYGESKLAGQTKSTETAESLHVFGQDNINFTDRWYGYSRLDGLHDGIADIKYRFTLAPGIGYYVIKNKISDLSFEVGPGYIFEELDDQSHDFATLRAGEKFHYALSPRSRLWETLEYLPEVDNFDNYTANGELGVESSLTKNDKLLLRTVLQDCYNSIPAPGRLRNDLKLIASIAFKF